MSEFHRVLLGVHAKARRIDRDQALLGAFGVAASFVYPHQIESVHRMVTGTACRWLLADEVGLGKTVEAIMLMRALAAQSPKPLNVVLVVPDDLVSQWEAELLSRGHTLALESGQEGDVAGNMILRLVRPSRLAENRIKATIIDLLVVDEFTKLQVQVRRDLFTAARVIPNIIVMTATPALHLPTTRSELLSLLEPEASRIALAERRDVLEVLAEREDRALVRYKDDIHNAEKRRAIEEAYGLYRRLIRTERTYYPDVLPRRTYQPIRVSPTDGDVERARTTHAYLEAARKSNVDIRREVLLQVAGRSRQSLRERLSTLKRTSGDLDAAWREIGQCIRDESGDAKLDALIDHLRKLHAKNPESRVVVVAEDNPTTDYLSGAIEKLTDVLVAKKRRSVTAAEYLEVQITLLKEALDDFISGEAKVLVAADAAKEGHNLQFADEIVFFALPWSPHDIQQWIGRIDRLGAIGLPAKRLIAITPIVVEGSIENNILNVLEGTGVFLRSEVFDEAEWQEISKAISAAVNGASWADAAKQAKSLGDSYGAWLQATRLPLSPRTAIASRCEQRFRDRRYAAPLFEVDGYPWDWFFARERAAEIMIKLSREDYLDVRKSKDGDHSERCGIRRQ